MKSLAFDNIAAEVGRLHREVSPMQANLDESAEVLRAALSSESEQTFEAIWILGCLPPTLTARLVPELVARASSERFTGDIRWLLGRLSYSDAERTVVPAAQEYLDSPEIDYFDFRQIAGLLDHLGLRTALSEVVAFMLSTNDPDIREVGEDFAS